MGRKGRKTMKFKRILCLAAALCLLWSIAIADGQYNGGALVNIYEKAVMPYNWTTQEPKETANVKYLLDGNRSTGFRHVCWDALAKDEIPEITYYFSGSTIKDIWIRNGWESSRYPYTAHARISVIRVVVWVGEQSYGSYRYDLEDTNDPYVYTPDMYDGYQRLSLPKKFENVTQVDIYIKGWAYTGDTYPYVSYMSDMIFLPDTLSNLYGNWIFDGGTPYAPTPTATPMPTWAPYPTWAPAPTATPQPVITEAPYNGLYVTTNQRLATRSGPGTTYTESGSYYQAGTRVKALTAAYDDRNGIWWIQVELSYAGELRRVYTGVKRLNMQAEDVPVEEVQTSAVLTRSVYAYWGPGYGYAMYKNAIPAGTSGTVYAWENAYAQFEYYDTEAGHTRRVWVPSGALEAGNG